MTKDQEQIKREIYDRIENDNGYAIASLLHVYSFQLEDEKAAEYTKYSNGVGFNGTDAGFMSSLATQYQKKGWLSDRQISAMKRNLKKYWSQIADYDLEPVKTKGNGNKEKQFPASKKVDLIKNELVISWSFPKGDPGFMETLKQIKSLTGTHWCPDEVSKPWKCKASLVNLRALKEWDFELSEAARDWHDSIMIDQSALTEVDPGLLGGDLYKFQKQGICFLNRSNGRALIGSEMGLGKTVQAIGYLNMNPDACPAVVVCPASLKGNWKREIRKWTGDKFTVHIISGLPNKKVTIPGFEVGKPAIIIINYDILANRTKIDKTDKPEFYGGKKKHIEIPKTGWIDFLPAINPKTLILDEIHKIKDNNANQTKAVKKLAKSCKHIIGLSGTPIINRPDEFYNAIQMINPNVFPGWRYYMTTFCAAYEGQWGWNTKGSSNTELLHKIMTNTIMIRHKKADVLSDLPAKTRSVIPLEIDNRSDYSAAESDIIGWIAKNFGDRAAEKASYAEALVEFEKLKQLAVHGKMKSVIEWVSDFLLSDEKLIIFADHKFVVDALMNTFSGISVKIDGSTPVKNRMAVVDAFQEDPNVRLFVGTKAAKEGLTLTISSNVAFAELFWTSGDHDQCEDRCYGRLSDLHGANAWYLIAQDTVEEKIAELLDHKRKVLASVLDGETVEDESLLLNLLENFK
jgi:SNF2 family DNA or RNA helicase